MNNVIPIRPLAERVPAAADRILDLYEKVGIPLVRGDRERIAEGLARVESATGVVVVTDRVVVLDTRKD
jgi:hypothetical protein